VILQGKAAVDVSPGDVTSLLNRLTEGDENAAAQLIPLVYRELHRLAARRMRNERPDHTLQATALVHETYLKLVSQRRANWQNRNQFFAVAAQQMRRILVDHARAQRGAKRGGGISKLQLEDVCVVSPQRSEEVLAVHESLTRLEQLDQRQARIVELHYFAGLTMQEIADVYAISLKTVNREWSTARAWLYGDLKEHREHNPGTMGRGESAL
jgi:RNA polymerase sigma factor (TIGR02999 family)